MWDRIKSAGWVTALAAVASAIVLGLAAAKSVNKQSSAKRKEGRAVDMMNSGIGREIHKGKKLLGAANKDKDAARILKLHLEVMQNPGVAYLTPDDIKGHKLNL